MNISLRPPSALGGLLAFVAALTCALTFASGSALAAASIEVAPAALENFHQVALGTTSPPNDLMVENDGNTTVSVTSDRWLTNNGDFTVAYDGCVGYTLEASSGSCEMEFQVTPTVPGPESATFELDLSDGSTVDIPLYVNPPQLDENVADAATGGAWTGNETTGAQAQTTASLANLTAGVTPTGTATYSLYNNWECGGAPVSTQTVSLNADGSIPGADPTAPLGGGWVSIQTTYSGDSNYPALTSPCWNDDVPAASVTLAGAVRDDLTGYPWTGTESTGWSAYDTANLSGVVSGFTPTGTVTYSLYAGSTCQGAAATTQTVSLSGGGVPSSNATAALGAGGHSYDAAYSGDSNYKPADSGCQPFTVAKNTSDAVNGQIDDDATGQAWASTETAGASAQDTASVPEVPGFTPTGTVTYSLYSDGACTDSAVYSLTVTLNGDGSIPASSASAPLTTGNWSYDASYSGDSNYATSDSGCQTFAVAKGNLGLGVVDEDAATGNPWAGTEITGASGQATAALTGAAAGIPTTGDVTYNLYDNPACSNTPTGHWVVTVNGDGSAPASGASGDLPAGTYSYDAAYSGDSDYTPATSTCRPFTVAKDTGAALNGTVTDAATGNPWAGNEVTNAKAADTAGLNGTVSGFTPTGTATYNLYDNSSCTGAPATTQTVTLNGDGTIPASDTTQALQAGSYGYDAVYSGDANYGAGDSGCQPFTVGQATQTVAFTSTAPASATYSQTYTVSATGGASGNPVTFNVDRASGAGVCTIADGTVTFTGVGDCVIDADQAGDANHQAGEAQQTVTVAKAALTVTADDAQMTSGSPLPDLTATITGFQFGQNLADSDVTGAPSCTTTAGAQSLPGRYPITCTQGTLASSDYTFRFAGGTLTVAAAPSHPAQPTQPPPPAQLGKPLVARVISVEHPTAHELLTQGEKVRIYCNQACSLNLSLQVYYRAIARGIRYGKLLGHTASMQPWTRVTVGQATVKLTRAGYQVVTVNVTAHQPRVADAGSILLGMYAHSGANLIGKHWMQIRGPHMHTIVAALNNSQH